MATDQGPLGPPCTANGRVFFLREGELALAEPILQRERGVELKPVTLKAFDMSPVQGVYFTSYRQARQCADRLRDLGWSRWRQTSTRQSAYLMERFITGSAELVGEIDSRGQYLVMEQAGDTLSQLPAIAEGGVLRYRDRHAGRAAVFHRRACVAAGGTRSAGCSCWGRVRTQDFVVSLPDTG